MVEKDDIAALLQTGSWRTSRSRSRDPHDSHRRAYDSSQAYDSSRAYESWVYESPRSNIGVPRTVERVSRSKRPPPPSVEDEHESLAKEHLGSVVSTTSDEEPKYRGEIDQHPILLPVHEHNAERRFVIVPGAADPDASDPTEARYEANTCRKYVIVDSGKSAESTAAGKEDKQKADLPKRKSHQDLPRLNTDFEQPEPSIRRSSSRHEREKVIVDQEPQRHTASREKGSARPGDDDFLSPAVRQTAGKREKAYWDSRSETGRRPARSPSTRRDVEVEVSNSRRPYHSTSKYASGHSPHRRTSSTASMPSREGPIPEGPRSSAQHFAEPRETPRQAFEDDVADVLEKPSSSSAPFKFNDPADIFAFMAPGDDFMSRRRGRDVSSSRSRYNNSPPHPRGAREMPGSSPNRRHQPRPGTRDRDGYSSDDSYRERRSGRTERPYPLRSTLEPDYPILSPDQAQQPNPKLGAAAPALAAIQTSHVLDNPPLPSSRSATFPADKSRRKSERSLSPSPPASTSPSRRHARGNRSGQSELHSRDGSIGSVSNGSGVLPPSIPSSLGRNNTMERRPAGGPVASLVREESSEPRSPVLYWQPGDKTDTDNDAQNNALAQLPDCRWKHPTVARNRAGSEMFLTLKRAENFMICPDCFGSVFANSEFQHLFVPAPVRSGGQLISCDFGSSPWYRIAYLMTLKHQYPDLRLLQGIESVAARSQACAGSQLATRIWYSVMAPNARHPVQTFNVCLGCAKMVEVLLPNLAGVFVPLDSHEPTRGICELHFTPERKRFFKYFGEMEATSDQALTRRHPPNIAELADRIRNISIHEECLRNTPIPNRKWHVLQRVPEFTVCEECFDAVVWPMVEGEDASEVPRNFYKFRQLRSVAACQLYSDRMRKVFREACEYNDFDYLASCVLERRSVLAAVKARYDELQREDQESPAVQEELGILARRFKEVE